MAAPSYTYSLANGTTADASQVMQNFNDILNGVSDGTKDLSINALTCAGAATLNGNTTIGNASSDDLTVTASLASSIPIKTTNSYNIGSSTLGLASIYLGANSQTVRILPSSSMSATWTLTLPVSAGTANYALTTNGSGTTSWTAWTTSAWYADASNAGTVSTTTQTFAGIKNNASMPAFRATKSADQTWNAAASTKTQITFATEAFDQGSVFASSTFTVPSGAGGIYWVEAKIRWEGANLAAGGVYRLYIRVNSTDQVRDSITCNVNGRAFTQTCSTVLSLSAADTVTIYAESDQNHSVSTVAISQGATAESWFHGFKLY